MGEGGEVYNIYLGHPIVNGVHPFYPICVVTSPGDNVIVTNCFTGSLYIINNTGRLLTFVYTKDAGIENPLWLAYNHSGTLYIGCNGKKGSKAKRTKFYEVDVSGC